MFDFIEHHAFAITIGHPPSTFQWNINSFACANKRTYNRHCFFVKLLRFMNEVWKTCRKPIAAIGLSTLQFNLDAFRSETDGVNNSWACFLPKSGFENPSVLRTSFICPSPLRLIRDQSLVSSIRTNKLTLIVGISPGPNLFISYSQPRSSHIRSALLGPTVRTRRF